MELASMRRVKWLAATHAHGLLGYKWRGDWSKRTLIAPCNSVLLWYLCRLRFKGRNSGRERGTVVRGGEEKAGRWKKEKEGGVRVGFEATKVAERIRSDKLRRVKGNRQKKVKRINEVTLPSH